MKKRSALFFLFFTAVSAIAAETANSKITLLGHNLTPTTYSLPQGKFTAGTYALAYGVTDHWTIGTSPWFDVLYNMPTVVNRISFTLNTFIERLNVELHYFKTFPYGLNRYIQESFFARVTGSHKFTAAYTLNVSAGYQYFFVDTRPYSLRLISGKSTPYNASVSTLSEIRLLDRFGVFLEMGVLGLNYSVPYLHLGASAFYHWDWGFFQFGFSQTSSMGEVPLYGPIVYVHPEIQLQTFF